MGTAVEAQALDLLDRLEDCGLAGGLTEEDFSPGAPVREPVRTACSELARRVWVLHESLHVASHAKLQQAVLRTLAAAESEATARAGQLDASLEALAVALDAAFRLPEGEGLLKRLRALETVVAAVQAGALVRARGAQESVTDAQVKEVLLTDEHVAASSSLRALAGVLEADAGAVSAVPLAAECRAAVDAAVRRLPEGFFAPILGVEDATLRESLAEVDAALRAEYRLRRRMLLERARVTVRSLLWSDRLDERERAALEARASEALAVAREEPATVAPAELLAVRLADVHATMNTATSTSAAGTRSTAIKRIVIGAVPDRGGRVEGRAAPMPAWAARRASAAKGAGGPQHHRQKRLKKGP